MFTLMECLWMQKLAYAKLKAWYHIYICMVCKKWGNTYQSKGLQVFEPSCVHHEGMIVLSNPRSEKQVLHFPCIFFDLIWSELVLFEISDCSLYIFTAENPLSGRWDGSTWPRNWISAHGIKLFLWKEI